MREIGKTDREVKRELKIKIERNKQIERVRRINELENTEKKNMIFVL